MAALVTLLFFVSGLAALVYQVVWVRVLGLVVGNSLWSAVAVVAAYMGGMAAGSAVVARLAHRLRVHLRWYAVAEAAAALFALATFAVAPLLAQAAAGLGPEPLSGWGVPLLGRFLLAWAFLLLPTAALGATLPLLVERVGGGPLAGKVGSLYAANTAGAVAGVVLGGFVGLPLLGERGTLSAAAILGLVVAAIAWLVEPHAPRLPPTPPRSRPTRSAWLVFPFVFGFVALACELVWTRLLLLHLGSRVYAFALILAIYLTGIAAGAALARFARGEPRTALAWVQAAVALALAAQLPVLARFGDLLGFLAVWLQPSGFFGLQATLALAVALLLLPATLAFGASFPLTVAAFGASRGATAATGGVNAANTLGGIGGALIGPLVLVPLLGSQLTLTALAAVAALAGAALAPSLRTRLAPLAALAAAIVVAVVMPAGAVLRGAEVIPDEELESLRESASATVVVRRIDDARGTWRSLELNGVNVAGTSTELRAIQRLQGHLPLLLHPEPLRVLHIGFGSGGTAWAVAQHPVREIVVAEISPEVLAVSNSVFGDVNHGVLADPRLRVVLNDGRNVLLASPLQFDVILSDSIHPVWAGNSTLYTREYFEMCRRRLTPGGVVSMWLPMYSLSEDSYLAILRAFAEVFPTAAVWYDPVVLNEFTVVTGSAEAGPLRLRWSLAGEPALAATLAEAGVRSASDLARMLLLGPGEVRLLVADQAPHVDDFPVVEYGSGRLLDREGSWLAVFRMLWAARAHESPFENYPGSWAEVVSVRDATIRAHLRELAARAASR